MTYVKNLICKECGKEYPIEKRSTCEDCFGPLDVRYNLSKIAENVNPDIIETRTKSIWRYKELLPVDISLEHVEINVGYTPLKKCEKLGSILGLKNLYIKDDTVNPTGSFKDRPASVAVTKALEWGLPAVGCASTGNLAGATAAAASNVGLPSYIFIPEGLATGKIISALAYGANVIEIKGTYDRTNRIANLVSDKKNWGIVNINIRPYYVEGSKTITYEICEQLGWNVPDRIIVPLGSGALLVSANKALGELRKLGWVKNATTKICGSQPEGCSPIVTALTTGNPNIIPVEQPTTIAKSLAIGDPASGYETKEIIKRTGGWGDAPADQEIIEAQLLLARTEGILSEPAGGSVIASLQRKVRSGEVDSDEVVVLYITGIGLKSTEVIAPFLNEPISSDGNIDVIEAILA